MDSFKFLNEVKKGLLKKKNRHFNLNKQNIIN